METPSPYGYDNPGPFTLYQAEDGKWGLVDRDGVKLPAKFTRGDKDCFSCEFNEVVTFDPNEGFTLMAWFDPWEVWFNFTFNNPDYPEQYLEYMWHQGKYGVPEKYEDHIPLLRQCAMVPQWLIDYLIESCDEDFDDESPRATEMKKQHPEILNFGETNALLLPTMESPDVPDNIKATLWATKLHFDFIIYWIDHRPDDDDN